MDIIKAFTEEQLKKEVPEVKVGDTVRVHNRIVEGSKSRIQIYEGTVIAKRGGGISETFTVRRISYGGKVRRAKLYYLRDRVGKAAKTKEDIQ